MVPRTVNKKGQADNVIEVVKPGSQLAADINNVFLKETEKEKFLPKDIVTMIQSEGFRRFTMRSHTALWQSKSAKDPKKGYGGWVAGKHWYWYKSWVEEVRKHCNENKEKYQ